MASREHGLKASTRFVEVKDGAGKGANDQTRNRNDYGQDSRPSVPRCETLYPTAKLYGGRVVFPYAICPLPIPAIHGHFSGLQTEVQSPVISQGGVY